MDRMELKVDKEARHEMPSPQHSMIKLKFTVFKIFKHFHVIFIRDMRKLPKNIQLAFFTILYFVIATFAFCVILTA